MRRALKWIGWSIAALIAVPAVLVLVLLVGANTPPGQTLIARLAPRLTGGLVTIEGLSGRFPDRLKAARLSLHDNKGIWATVDDLDSRLVSATARFRRYRDPSDRGNENRCPALAGELGKLIGLAICDRYRRPACRPVGYRAGSNRNGRIAWLSMGPVRSHRLS